MRKPPSLPLPTFSLQPIVENAVKHGTSQLLGPGVVQIGAEYRDGNLVIWVKDNAGLYHPQPLGDGLGMNLVDRRIKARFGERYGLHVTSQAEEWTLVEIQLPSQLEAVV